MKVVVYCHTVSGGHWQYSVELARGLAESGQADVVIATANSAPDVEGVHVARIVRDVDTALRGLRRVLNRVKAYTTHGRTLAAYLTESTAPIEGAIVHLQEIPTIGGRALIARCQRQGSKVVLTVHNVTPHEATSMRTRARSASALRAWRQADLLIVHGETMAGDLRRILGPDSVISVVPHPVWKVSHVAALEHDRRDFLFFGHLRGNKGLDLFVEALAQLGDPPSSIIGSGPPEMVEWVESLLKRHGLQNCRLEAGFVPDELIPSVFSNHRVLVAPYGEFNAQSGVTHLAVAHGIPIVVTDVGGLGDIVRDFGVGYVADRDPKDLAAKMHECVAAENWPSLRQGIATAIQELAPETLALRLVKAYAKV